MEMPLFTYIPGITKATWQKEFPKFCSEQKTFWKLLLWQITPSLINICFRRWSYCRVIYLLSASRTQSSRFLMFNISAHKARVRAIHLREQGMADSGLCFPSAFLANSSFSNHRRRNITHQGRSAALFRELKVRNFSTRRSTTATAN